MELHRILGGRQRASSGDDGRSKLGASLGSMACCVISMLLGTSVQKGWANCPPCPCLYLYFYAYCMVSRIGNTSTFVLTKKAEGLLAQLVSSNVTAKLTFFFFGKSTTDGLIRVYSIRPATQVKIQERMAKARCPVVEGHYPSPSVLLEHKKFGKARTKVEMKLESIQTAHWTIQQQG